MSYVSFNYYQIFVAVILMLSQIETKIGSITENHFFLDNNRYITDNKETKKYTYIVLFQNPA